MDGTSVVCLECLGSGLAPEFQLCDKVTSVNVEDCVETALVKMRKILCACGR